jgi:hypothetical protein
MYYRVLRIYTLKRDEATGWRRRLHNVELHDLYSSPNIIRMIKSIIIGWAGQVSFMGERRGADRVLVARPEGKRPVGRSRSRWENKIKMDPQ